MVPAMTGCKVVRVVFQPLGPRSGGSTSGKAEGAADAAGTALVR